MHHITAFDGNNTTLANGICLCRFHHMQLHANSWTIDARTDGTHWLTPPPTHDGQPGIHPQPTQLHTKSPLPLTG